jgi:hypothetical protein
LLLLCFGQNENATNNEFQKLIAVIPKAINNKNEAVHLRQHRTIANKTAAFTENIPPGTSLIAKTIIGFASAIPSCLSRYTVSKASVKVEIPKMENASHFVRFRSCSTSRWLT